LLLDHDHQGPPVPTPRLDPLPFRLTRPGWDSMGFHGIESVSHRADGILHVTGQGVMLEWAEVQTVEEVSLEHVGTDVIELPPEWLQLPSDRIAGAWLVGGWWSPCLDLRACELADLEGVPGVRGVTLRLRIHRRDRPLARAIAQVIASRIEARRLGAT